MCRCRVRACSPLRVTPRALRRSAAASCFKKFTEPVALLSTQPTDLPLPRTALGRRFNLLALRARCVEEPTRSTHQNPFPDCSPAAAPGPIRSGATQPGSQTLVNIVTSERVRSPRLPEPPSVPLRLVQPAAKGPYGINRRVIVRPPTQPRTRAGRDRVWVDGSIHYWLRTVAATAGKTTTPLYAIAPVDRARPLHPLADARTKGFGAHDHVIADPHPNRAFVTVCNLTLVLPGPRSKVGSNTLVRRTTTPFGQRTLVYAVNLGNGVQPLTSAARIKRARQLGLATLSPIASSGFGCRIEPG